jgi:hypothetical protein
MGKFSKKAREYSFVSLENMITDIMQEYDDKNDIGIILSWNEVPDFISALISTGKFKIKSLDWTYPESRGYDKEYCITLINIDDDEIYLEKCWIEEKDMYCNCLGENDITFVSQDVSKTLQDKICNESDNIILFDIED